MTNDVWVLKFSNGPNRMLIEEVTVWVKDYKTACFDISDAKKFNNECSADQFKKDSGSKLRYFEPVKIKNKCKKEN